LLQTWRVRLYLSSFRLGSHGHRLLALLGTGRRTALVSNALDGLPDADRERGLRRDVDELARAGLDVELVDVRVPGAVADLGRFDLVWVRGGNVFVLRRALADSGADEVLVGLLRRDQVVYGGYSAGACVLGPDLSELSRVDDQSVVVVPITTGLGLLDRPFVPHVRTPDHPESLACDEVAAAYASRGRAHWALRDGQVLLVDGPAIEVLQQI
jgi:dipeptidase E